MNTCQSGRRPEIREDFRRPQFLLLCVKKPQFFDALTPRIAAGCIVLLALFEGLGGKSLLLADVHGYKTNNYCNRSKRDYPGIILLIQEQGDRFAGGAADDNGDNVRNEGKHTAEEGYEHGRAIHTVHDIIYLFAHFNSSLQTEYRQQTNECNNRHDIVYKDPDGAVLKSRTELSFSNTHTGIYTCAIRRGDAVHCAADAGQHGAGDHRITAGSSDNGNNDTAKYLYLSGTGYKHTKNSSEHGQYQCQRPKAHIQRGNVFADSLFDTQAAEYIAYEISKQYQRCGGNDLQHALADIVIHELGRHLATGLLTGEQDAGNNDKCGDIEQDAVGKCRGACTQTSLKEAAEFGSQEEGQEYDNRQENCLPAALYRLPEAGDIFLAHGFDLIVPAHKVEGHDTAKDEPGGNAPKDYPELRNGVGSGIHTVVNSKCSGDHACRRYHVAHGAGMCFYVGCKVRRETGTLHCRNGEHAGGGNVAGAGAGQGAHVSRTDDGYKSCTAAQTAEDRQNDRNTIVDNAGL